jgi:hypothetical protein
MISCVDSLSMTSPSPACTFVSTTIALVNKLEEIEDEDDEFLVDDDFTKSAGPIISHSKTLRKLRIEDTASSGVTLKISCPFSKRWP